MAKNAKSRGFRWFGGYTKQPKEKGERQEEQDDLISHPGPVRVPQQSELPEWEPPKNDSGLIMLEID
jgi:hypothetical protein